MERTESAWICTYDGERWNIKSEKMTNVTFSTLNSLMTALGYRVTIEKIEKTKRKVKEKR